MSTSFGRRLKELREAKGQTQATIAKAAKLTTNAVALLEQGRRRPTWDTVTALADALGVNVDAFRQEAAEEPPRRGRPRGKGKG